MFINDFIEFLNQAGVLPPEVLNTDTDRDKTYLYELPADPINVYAVDIYDQRPLGLGAGDAQLVRIQFTVRHQQAEEAEKRIYKIYDFIRSLSSAQTDYIIIVGLHKAIVQVHIGPKRIMRNAKMHHQWTMSVSIKFV